VPVPAGGLATSVDAALEIAARIGYPVVAKAQAATLAHKSDVGGVLLDIRDEDALRAGWRRLHETISAKRPGLTLDGVLVEQMSRHGVEMVIGARRDPRWGAVLLVGLGGVHVEVLNDVRLLAADLPQDAIAAEIERLKGARLLRGFRGTEPVDVEAVAAVAAAVGRLVRADPRITEIDVNPVIAYPHGNGAVALDALVVTTDQKP
jgi:acyl-CoA synthetase (NDP forming)